MTAELMRFKIAPSGMLEDEIGSWVRYADAQAAIAAALMGVAVMAKKEARQQIQGAIVCYGEMCEFEADSAADDVAGVVLASISTDTTAALNAMIHQAREGALESVAQWHDERFAMTMVVAHSASAAAIRAMKGGK